MVQLHPPKPLFMPCKCFLQKLLCNFFLFFFFLRKRKRPSEHTHCLLYQCRIFSSAPSPAISIPALRLKRMRIIFKGADPTQSPSAAAGGEREGGEEGGGLPCSTASPAPSEDRSPGASPDERNTGWGAGRTHSSAPRLGLGFPFFFSFFGGIFNSPCLSFQHPLKQSIIFTQPNCREMPFCISLHPTTPHARFLKGRKRKLHHTAEMTINWHAAPSDGAT